jgi:proline iminopeptidase
MDGIFYTNVVYDHQTISVPDGHKLYVEQSGNPKGIPIIYMHGGPGAGIGTNYQWPFNPLKYRVIGVDQRGCGHSTPFGDTENNTTQLLIEDFEVIRATLGIEKWVLFGGSWGSTLALIYSIQHPSSVISMILRGVFLARKEDFDWYLLPTGCAAQIFPEAYEMFSNHIIDKSSSDKMCQQFISLFKHPNPQISGSALESWFNWEGHISRLIAPNIVMSDMSTDKQVKSLALLECHYLLNRCFIEENFILNNLHKIEHIHCHIVHGRYDMVCKVEAAYAIHKRLPESTLKVVDNAGHSMSEPGIAKELTTIMDHIFELGDHV